MRKKRGKPGIPAGIAAQWLDGTRRGASALLSDISKTGLNSLVLVFALLILLGAAVVTLLERSSGNRAFKDAFDGLWWAVVTIATVGYGDAYPASAAGRAVAIVFILFGFVLTALISGTVASIFVERRIREGKGLRELKLKGHVVVCGWNPGAAELVAALDREGGGKRPVLALVNDREGDWFEALQAEHPGIDMKFVRGRFWDEATLLRASLPAARAVIIVPDQSGAEGLANADERSILAALTCQSLNPEARIAAEILHAENAPHMRRAGVADLVVKGEFSAFLLSSACSSSGLSSAARRVLSRDRGMRLARIPPHFVGKTFLEASEHFMRSGTGLMIGLYSEEKVVSLEDLISDDSSAIDAFIKRKFKESALDLGSGGSAEERIRLNPGADCPIREGDSAFILG